MKWRRKASPENEECPDCYGLQALRGRGKGRWMCRFCGLIVWWGPVKVMVRMAVDSKTR